MRLKVPFLGYLLAFCGLLLPSAILVTLLPSPIDVHAARERLIADLGAWANGRVEVARATSINGYFESTVVLKDVTITQLNTLPAVHSMRAQQIEARVSSLGLIFGNLNFREIKISGATMNVDAANPREAANSILTMLSGAPENPFATFELHDSVVVVREGPGKPSRSMHVESARATVEKPAGVVAASGVLEWDCEFLKFSVHRGLAESGSARIPLRLKLDGRLFAVEFDGDVVPGTAWQATGLASVHTIDATRFYAWLGFGARPVATDSFGVKGAVTATPEQVSVTSAEFSLGGQVASGDLTAKWTGTTPHLEGKLVLGELDLDRMVEPDKGAVRLLPFADAAKVDFRVSADSVKWRGLRTGNAAFTVSAQPQHLSVDIAELDFMDGAVRGQLEIDPAERPFRVRTRLIANNMNVSSLIALWGPGEWLRGKGDADLKGEIRWADGQLLDGSSGQARVSFPEGGRVGLDLVGLANNAAAEPIDGWGAMKSGSTSFDDMRFALSMQNGRVRWENLELQAGREMITSAGSFDLRHSMVDARFVIIPERTDAGEKPQAATMAANTEQRIGLSISGAWSHPVIRAEMSQSGDPENGPAKAAVLEVPEPER